MSAECGHFRSSIDAYSCSKHVEKSSEPHIGPLQRANIANQLELLSAGQECHRSVGSAQLVMSEK